MHHNCVDLQHCRVDMQQRQRGVICLKSISIAIKHCVTLLRYVVTCRCVNVGKTELFKHI